MASQFEIQQNNNNNNNKTHCVNDAFRMFYIFKIVLLLILYCTVHILQHERVYSRYVCVNDYILKNVYKK
jgi:hypothetical protein